MQLMGESIYEMRTKLWHIFHQFNIPNKDGIYKQKNGLPFYIIFTNICFDENENIIEAKLYVGEFEGSQMAESK